MSREQDERITVQLKKVNTPKKPAFTTLSDILFQRHYFMIYLIAHVTHLKRMFLLLSDHKWDFRPFKIVFSQYFAFRKVATLFRLNDITYLLTGGQGFLGQVVTLRGFSCWKHLTASCYTL